MDHLKSCASAKEEVQALRIAATLCCSGYVGEEADKWLDRGEDLEQGVDVARIPELGQPAGRHAFSEKRLHAPARTRTRTHTPHAHAHAQGRKCTVTVP